VQTPLLLAGVVKTMRHPQLFQESVAFLTQVQWLASSVT